MNIVLELPPDLESALSAEAAREGLTLAEYAIRKLAEGRADGESPRTGSELVAYWEKEGLIGSRPDIVDSQEHARLLRDRAERRPRE